MLNVFFIFFKVIAAIHASKSRSVNVALETVLEFDNKDDISFIDTMQNFLNKLKTEITRSRALNDRDNIPEQISLKNEFVFTDFLAETVSVLRSFKDEDLKNFFDALRREIELWQTRKEFHEIRDVSGFRRIIDRNMQRLKNSSMSEIRRKLNSLSQKLNFNNRKGTNSFISDFLNYFYKKESSTRLTQFLSNLKLYKSRSRRNNEIDLEKIIHNGIMSIIRPLLKLKSNEIDNIFKEYINKSKARKEYAKHKENTNAESKQNENYKDFPKYDVLDYIEEHKRIIDKRLTTAKLKLVPERLKTAKFNRFTTKSRKNRKLKKENRERRIDIKLMEEVSEMNDNERHSTRDSNPVLIKLARNANSVLKNIVNYLSSTTERQKRYKKSTRSREIENIDVYVKTTNKFRKAFRTPTTSAEGLSIEHFGSLSSREFHGKRNDNESIGYIMFNSSTTVFDGDTMKKEHTNEFPQEMRRNNNLNDKRNEYNIGNHDETKILSDNDEENIKSIGNVENQGAITESIKIQGNIIIEKSNEASITNAKDTHEITTDRNFNVSIVTKYYNMPLEPTVIRRQETTRDVSNKTNISARKDFTETQTTLAEFTSLSANETETDGNIKTTEDGLENEIEGIIDKHNATSSMGLEKPLKSMEVNGGVTAKVRDKMQEDLAKIFASTESSVTELFKDVDKTTDIL